MKDFVNSKPKQELNVLASNLMDTKTQNLKQVSMNRFVYRKQNPQANHNWMQRLKIEFESLESANPESDDCLDEIDFENDAKMEPQGKIFEENKFSERFNEADEFLEDIICDWADDDFDDNAQVDNTNVVSEEEDHTREFNEIEGESENEPNKERLLTTVGHQNFESSDEATKKMFNDIVSGWNIDDFEDDSFCDDGKILSMESEPAKEVFGGMQIESKDANDKISEEKTVDMEIKDNTTLDNDINEQSCFFKNGGHHFSSVISQDHENLIKRKKVDEAGGVEVQDEPTFERPIDRCVEEGGTNNVDGFSGVGIVHDNQTV